MPRLLSYADAAKLLGGTRSPLVTALDAAAGGVLLGAAPLVPGVLSWFDAKAEFIRLSHDLVSKVSERRTGLSRYSRTQRLHAAHTVLVVTAFFEALAATAELPYRLADLDVTRQEQLQLTDPTTAVAASARNLAELCRTASVPLPAPHESSEVFEARLHRYYLEYAQRFHAFAAGLAAGSAAPAAGGPGGPERSGSGARAADLALVEAASQRYRELLRQLCGEFPEVAWWAGRREHQATRAEVRVLGAALAGVERRLAETTTGRAPDDRRRGLARTYRAILDRPVTESGDAPPGIRIPTLAAAYLEPLFRVAPVQFAAQASDQGWWERWPVRGDLEVFLTGYLTAPPASTAPLLVLGQPGSGKSVLTKVLAARLPAEDFLPVRVVLREVPTQADLQDQIEYAIRAATGDRLSWPDLARSAGDALPVVLLDGFDELLQATGVSQSDYLTRVAQFQEREALQGRPVAVIVTSRTSVADRAQPAPDTVAVRLEPFDDVRVTEWLSRWNAANADHFAATGLAELSPATVLAHRDLASQPLLLLMLALYDAPENALRQITGTLGEGELYERLLKDFCTREVIKHRPALRDHELPGAVEDEVRRLSIVAFGMFNRRALWITEADLDADLVALLGQVAAAGVPGVRSPLGRAETVLGRFFFIHRSQAMRNDQRLVTYEFLHATFGEYLVARFTWLVLRDTAARDRAATLRMTATVADDLLHALLSVAPICLRGPIVSFLVERFGQLDQAERDALGDLVISLYRTVHEPRPARAFAGYQPGPRRVPARHAAYSANLMVLAVCLRGTLLASDLYPEAATDPGLDPVDRWHRETLLWRSQLNGEGWSRIVDTVRVYRIWRDGRRDLLLSLDDGSFKAPAVDLCWTYAYATNAGAADQPAAESAFWWARQESHHHPDILRRKANFQCGNLDDIAHDALEPVFAAIPETINTTLSRAGSQVSAARLLLGLWLPAESGSTDDRAEHYRILSSLMEFPTLPPPVRRISIQLLLNSLATDGDVSPNLVAEVLGRLTRPVILTHHVIIEHGVPKSGVARCAIVHLGRDPEADQRIADVVLRVLRFREVGEHRLHAEALVRAWEKAPSQFKTRDVDELWQAVRGPWPDLARRVRDAHAYRPR